MREQSLSVARLMLGVGVAALGLASMLVPGDHPGRHRVVLDAATRWRPLSAAERVDPRMVHAVGGVVLGMILALAGGFIGAMIAGIGRAAARHAGRSGRPRGP